MDFMKEYESWLASEALSAAEKAELEAIRNLHYRRLPRKQVQGA